MRFTTFRHGRKLCRARLKLKGKKVRLGLTKSRYDLLSNPKNYFKQIATIRLSMLNVELRSNSLVKIRKMFSSRQWMNYETSLKWKSKGANLISS